MGSWLAIILLFDLPDSCPFNADPGHQPFLFEDISPSCSKMKA